MIYGCFIVTIAIRDAEVSEDEIENVPPKSAAAPVEKTTVNKTVTSQSQQGAAAVKGQVKDIPHEASSTKALSAEAKSVLADLISDNSGTVTCFGSFRFLTLAYKHLQ